MKKKVLSIAVLLASVFTATSMAQAPGSDQPTCPAGTERKAPKGAPGQGQAPNPFEGLNLTAEQQSQLQALREQARTQREQAKAEKKADKAQRMEAADSCRNQARKEYLAQIKGILTADQYVQFLENAYMQQRPQQGPQQGPNGRGPQAFNGKRTGKQGKRNIARQATQTVQTVQNSVN